MRVLTLFIHLDDNPVTQSFLNHPDVIILEEHLVLNSIVGYTEYVVSTPVSLICDMLLRNSDFMFFTGGLPPGTQPLRLNKALLLELEKECGVERD